MTGRRIAVVLFNLGGPDGPEAVRPFLFNLFDDPAIIGLPGVVRTPLAAFIARRREDAAKANYALMGGASPLLPETVKQARALEGVLGLRLPGDEVRCFVAMRYWTPLTTETAAEVAAFAPDEIVLLPLYPQYSTTTTASSLAAWRRAYRGPGVSRAICCYFDEPGLVEAHARAIRRAHEAVGAPRPLRVLFSAHGLPERVVRRGDPYVWQVERTCEAVAARLAADWPEGWDWRIGYQSRVGPLKWVGPSTAEALAAAAADGRGVVVAPIAFVSEHIETLVELDHEYADLARDLGLPFYLRAPAIGADLAFIEGLADATVDALNRTGVAPDCEACPGGLRQCPYRREAA